MYKEISKHSALVRTDRLRSTLQSSLFIFIVMTFLALMISSASVEAKNITDREISTSIVTDMMLDEIVDANKIDVATDKGIVTFTGSVDNLLAKDRATAIASSIVGVRSVVNRIKINPHIKRSDAELAIEVEKALFNDPATDSYEVSTAVSDGKVTLTGTVDSWQEKQLCATVTKGVRGVKAIQNDINVDFNMDRLDAEIKPEVERKLANDVRVDDNLIDVSVNNGIVELSGTVGSLAEKNRAVTESWVEGVAKVNAEELKIKWWARDSMRRKSSYAKKSDDEIKKAVEDAFIYDPRVFSFHPQVTVNNGTVILNGTVDNLQAKQAAERDARNTVGVWRVKNHLRVQPEIIPEDTELEKRVKKAIGNDPYVSKYDVDVDANSGWVTLKGSVNNSYEDNMASVIASRVKGVTGVTNNLDYEYEWSWKPDWEIKQDVIDEMFWSPFVTEDDVTVEVERGIVTLDGNVETWSERLNAEKSAWEGGAKDVRNDLTVTYQFYGPYPSFFPHLAPDNTLVEYNDNWSWSLRK